MADEAPRPKKRARVRELHGEAFVDDYAWLAERDDPAVRAHLEAERAHAEARLDAATGDLRARLVDELRARLIEDDESVPARDGAWLYSTRTELGDEYARHCRRPRAPSSAGPSAGPEQVYLDENLLAEGHDYFDLACLTISPNHRWCAYAVDLDGDEIYTIRVKDLDSGELLADAIEGCGASLAWADDETLFYTRVDARMRPWQAWRHRLGTPASADSCVLREDDRRYYLGLHRARSGAFVVLSLDSQVSSEAWLVPTATPTAAPILVEARREGVEYGIAHHAAHLLVLSNADAVNFCVELRGLPGASADERRCLIPGREDVLIEDLDVFAGHLVVWERHGGQQRLRVVPLEPMPARAGDDDAPAPGEHLIEFSEPCCTLWGASNFEYDARVFRFGYSSLTTPDTVYDYDLRTRERWVRKRAEVGGGHDPGRYRSAQIWASAADGERVPISLVWRRDEDEDASTASPVRPRPLILDGYGAYGHPCEASFSRARLSLLDRGVVWAIAHVRGGGELGRRWYEAGKLGAKHNSFDDFIACAEHLIAQGWTTPTQLAATGGSAGGLLVGVVANARPELFAALVADVPFVDVLNTMLDPDLPLTVIEREEWGDPRTAEGYRWIRAYSPYDNVRAQDYPALFVLAGWNDPRVGYWEAAKWVARLRELKTDEREILLWTNMDAGHAGASGRFESLHELALEFAFLIDRLGLPAAIPRRTKARPPLASPRSQI